MQTICDINKLIHNGQITSFAQSAPNNVHKMDVGKYYGVAGIGNAPTATVPYYYQVFKLGNGDRQVVAHSTTDGSTYQLIEHAGKWGKWRDMSGYSAYEIWKNLDPINNTLSKAAWLATLKGPKGDKGDSLVGAFATQHEVDAGVSANKAVSPKTLNIAHIMNFKGNSHGDVNKDIKMGVYAAQPNTLNAPTTHEGVVTTKVTHHAYTQEFLDVATGNIYTRFKRGAGVYSAWKRSHQEGDGFGCKVVVIAQDWNTLLEDGIYEVRGATGTNRPSPTDYLNGLVTVMGNGCKHARQIFTPAETTGAIAPMFIRTKYGNTWGNWAVHGAMEFDLAAKTLTITL